MNIRDLRIKQELRLVSPVELEDSLPVSSQVLKTVIENRETVNRIILGQDSRLLAIVGPCSIHDPASAYDYALKLKKLSEEVYELQEAINDAKGYPIASEHKAHIAEEIADVAVMLNQYIEYFNLDGYLIDDIIYDKTDRTIARIESGYYDKK